MALAGWEPAKRMRDKVQRFRLPAFAAEAAATAAGAFRLRSRFIDVQRSAIQVHTVDGGNCPLALAIVCHFHEAKAASLTSVPVGDDVDTVNSSVVFKQRTDRLFRSPKAEVSNKNIFQFTFPLLI
jgi:hypothetical protein